MHIMECTNLKLLACWEWTSISKINRLYLGAPYVLYTLDVPGAYRVNCGYG